MREMIRTLTLMTMAAGGWLCAAMAAQTEDPIAHASRRGMMMFEYDRAAWLTSDDLLAKLPPDRQAEVGGWVVTPKGDGYHVDYIGKDGASESVIYSSGVQGDAVANAVINPAPAAPKLEGAALRMSRALVAARAEMAKHADWQPCAQAMFNTVVLPPENGVTPVYFMTPQTIDGSFPFGGHYEVDVAEDGHIVSTRPFTRACLEMTNLKGDKPAYIGVSHLLDPHPTEIHVFQQYHAGIPVLVVTGENLFWQVENGHILPAVAPKE